MDDDGIDIDKSILKAILKGLEALFKQLFTMYGSMRYNNNHAVYSLFLLNFSKTETIFNSAGPGK